MIVSNIDGRVRIRHPELTNAAVVEGLKAGLGSGRGVQNVVVNMRIGSLLVMYDPQTADIEAIKGMLSPYLGGGEGREGAGGKLSRYLGERGEKAVGKALSSFNARKAVRAGMLASLFLSLIAALFGAKALHVAAGLVFLMFMTIHLTKYGNLIFA